MIFFTYGAKPIPNWHNGHSNLAVPVREVTPNCWENEPGLCSGSKQPGADSEEALCLARAFVLQQIGGI